MKKEMNWNEVVGKVVLVRMNKYFYSPIFECRVLRISPSGGHVLLAFKRSNDIGYASEYWKDINEYEILDVLY